MNLLAKRVNIGVCLLIGLWTVRADDRTDILARLSAEAVAAYGSIEGSPVSTGILYDLVLPLSGIERYNARPTATVASTTDWRQVAHELRRASMVETDLPSDAEFRGMGRAAAREHVHPLLILFYHYDRIRPGLSRDAVLRGTGDEIQIPVDAFESSQVFAAAPLHSWTYRGAEVRFRADLGSLYFSNDPRPVETLEADFDDGLGLRILPASGETLVRYPTTGLKYLRVVLTLADGTRLTAYSLLDVRELRTPEPSQTWVLQADSAYDGLHATGEAYILLADGHTAVTNPVIVSEGFDIANAMNWDELYAGLNEENLLETIRAMGYDAVVLNYTDAMTHLQRNALLVETLIDSVNSVIAPEQTSIVMGPSMGGLTTRYALTNMEANGVSHRVRSWVSFDAPQTGANVPLGMQYWIDFFATESAEAAAMRDALNAPGARQMLLTHFTNPPANVAAPDPMHAAFFNELAQLGNYPVQPRKAAMSNGSGYQVSLPFGPGSQLILWEYRSWALDITGNVWALHNLQPQTVFYGEQDLLWPLPDRFLTVNVQPAWPWDNAPGGTRNSLSQLDSVAAPYGDIQALHPDHCFVPTTSALGLSVTDPFYNIAGDLDLYAHTVFDTLYFPQQNQGHVDVTPENYEWLLFETAGTLSAPVVVVQVGANGTQILWWPVAGARSYRIQTAEDSESWPAQYVATADTSWLDPDTSALRRFYRITASTALP